jgi:hypothetical protein
MPTIRLHNENVIAELISKAAMLYKCLAFATRVKQSSSRTMDYINKTKKKHVNMS